jgi:hypothetical protein
MCIESLGLPGYQSHGNHNSTFDENIFKAMPNPTNHSTGRCTIKPRSASEFSP